MTKIETVTWTAFMQYLMINIMNENIQLFCLLKKIWTESGNYFIFTYAN